MALLKRGQVSCRLARATISISTEPTPPASVAVNQPRTRPPRTMAKTTITSPTSRRAANFSAQVKLSPAGQALGRSLQTIQMAPMNSTVIKRAGMTPATNRRPMDSSVSTP